MTSQGLAVGIDHLVKVGRAEGPRGDEVRVAHERAMHADDAHAILDGEQRAGGWFWQREPCVKERGGLREHALHGLGGDEPGLAGEKRIKCGHAPVGVSKLSHIPG